MYYYESLGDERFQEFCQAIVTASFPTAQCLPIGQPDGGRDAFVFRLAAAKRHRPAAARDLIVFQVKYVKSPADDRSEREMIEEVVKKEAPKVEKLKSMGLSKYILLTNLKGTAHLETGAIDRVNKQLSEALSIEAYCWWRDDLDRRLDNNSSIKWSYPEVLKATDLLEKLVSGNLGEDEERRRGAVRAYMTAQYDDDQELKFKQTELRSTMTELFVDLPMRPSPIPNSIEILRNHSIVYQRFSRPYHSARTFYRPANVHLSSSDIYSEDDVYRAAEYLISTSSQSKLSCIVLEGAPGQGKSTITQFICQILRTRLLDKREELENLPKVFQIVQLSLPFRVDLRDLAKWIAGTDPFQSKPEPLEEKQPRSLEGFLAAQVRAVSGGHDFNVSDLTAVARASHIFIALDGFDEVADVTLRQRLVDEISKGVSRLVSAGGFSVRTMVTSRPAAFAKSVRFPREQWRYFELLPLFRPQVDEYTTKWMKAKGLKELEKAELRRVLDVKLKEPHTQYLAKNPMQLTILLSLIHNRGASLPERRTALYDAYMDMFFSRESEKSDIVRDNRDLLIDIHRYIAWKLQTAAEGGENGSIAYGTLRSTLFSYLDREGEETSIVDALFNGLIERVGVLVSRVQDTYEFEVQPLREYFAARHLYDTSPYPSADGGQIGDKLDRFNALIRNPYWLNVARFYGGCFNKGEILTLVNELIEFGAKPPYMFTSLPRSISLMLLGDWVFTQYQPAVKKIVSFIGEQPRLRQLLVNSEWSELPERSGRADFVDTLWKCAVATEHRDEHAAIAHAIVANSAVEDRIAGWEKTRVEIPDDEWTRFGSSLGLFDLNNLAQLAALREPLTDQLVERLVEAGRFDFLEPPERFDAGRAAILHRIVLGNPRVHGTTTGRLGWLAAETAIYQYILALRPESGLPLYQILDQQIGGSLFRKTDPKNKKNQSSDLPEAERRAVNAYLEFIELTATATSLDPWIELVEAMRGAWGDCIAVDRIAFLGAGVRSKSVEGIDAPLENSSDLVSAARFVRLKSGAARWWEDKLEKERNPNEVRRLLLLLWLWATPNTVMKLLVRLRHVLATMADDQWLSINRELYFLRQLLGERDTPSGETDLAKISKLGSRVSVFVGQRLTSESQAILAAKMLESGAPMLAPESSFALRAILSGDHSGRRWRAVLPQIAKLYAEGAQAPHLSFDRQLPQNIAQLICEKPNRYPLQLVANADAELRSIAGTGAEKLLEVARRQGWFTE